MNQGLVLEARYFLVLLLKLANSLANSLGTQTASLLEPDGTTSFFFIYLPQAVWVFLNFFSASAGLTVNKNFNLCNFCPAVQFLVLGFYNLAKLIV